MDNNTRYTVPLIVTIIIFAGLLLAAIMYVFQADSEDVDIPRKDATTSNEETDSTTMQESTTTTSPSNVTNETARTERGQNLKDTGEIYEAAIKQYGDYRIQLENCRAFPFRLEVPNGTNILLDGFSPDPQRVTIGNNTVILEGYDAEPIRIEAPEPTTLSIHCEAHGNSYPNIGEVEIYL